MNTLKVIVSLLVISMLSCQKSGDQDLEVSILPEQTTLLNIPNYSCVDFVLDNTPTTGSLTPSTFTFKVVSFTWKNKDRDLRIVSIRVVVKHPDIDGGRYDFTVPPEELNVVASSGNILKCPWCEIAHATEGKNTVITLSETKPFIYPAHYNYVDGAEVPVPEATLSAATCGIRGGGFKLNPNVNSDRTFSGKMLIQGISINKRDPTDITNLYVTTPIKFIYQAPPP
jgi:hypothetical protein